MLINQLIRYSDIYKGAMLMPNTFTIQENIQTEVNYYLDKKNWANMLRPHLFVLFKRVHDVAVFI